MSEACGGRYSIESGTRSRRQKHESSVHLQIRGRNEVVELVCHAVNLINLPEHAREDRIALCVRLCQTQNRDVISDARSTVRQVDGEKIESDVDTDSRSFFIRLAVDGEGRRSTAVANDTNVNGGRHLIRHRFHKLHTMKRTEEQRQSERLDK